MLFSLLACAQSSQQGEIDVLKFDRGDGITVISYFTRGYGCAGRAWGAEFSYGAEGVRGVRSVKLGHNHIYSDSPQLGEPLRVEADGSTYDLGPVSELGFAALRNCRNLTLAYGVNVKRAVFLRIADAKSLAIWIGSRKMDLRYEDIEALRTIARRLK